MPTPNVQTNSVLFLLVVCVTWKTTPLDKNRSVHQKRNLQKHLPKAIFRESTVDCRLLILKLE